MASLGKTYDIFVSYAREDNKKGWITAFVESLKKQHDRFAPGRPLEVFFDQGCIPARSDWTLILTDRIAHSSLFLAFLSPAYLASEWCKKEWMAWLDHEVAVHILTEGIQKILVVPVENLHSKDVSEEDLVKQIRQYCKSRSDEFSLEMLGVPVIRQIRRRQSSNDFTQQFLRKGSRAMKHQTIKKILKELADEAVSHSERVGKGDLSERSVPDYNRNFTGRVEELLILRDWLCKDDRTGVIYGIHGLGGIGKTELAFAYAHAFAYAYPGGRFLIGCDGKRTLQEAILTDKDFPARFNADIRDKDSMLPEHYYTRLRMKINERLQEKGAILIILDNVTDLSILSKDQTGLLTSAGANLHILATTRQRPGSITHDKWLTLDRLSKLESLSLLEKFKPFNDELEEEAAINIVNYLDGFALGVEVVGASLVVNNETYRRVANRLDINKLDDMGSDEDVETMRHRDEQRLSAVLAPSLKKLKQEARCALEFASLLPPDAVALPWLKELVGAEYPSILDEKVYPNPWNAIVGQLEKLALITFNSSEDRKMVRVHRLVQASTIRLAENARTSARYQQRVEQHAEARIRHLLEIQINDNEAWELEPLIIQVGMWLSVGNDCATKLRDMLRTCLEGLQYDFSLGDASTASEPLVRRLQSVAEKAFGSGRPVMSTSIGSLPTYALRQATASEEINLVRENLEKEIIANGTSHPNVARAMFELARILHSNNQLVDAEVYYRGALRIDESSFGESHNLVARDLNNLAQLMQDTNRLSEAEPLLRRAISIEQESLGNQHPNVARYLNNLSALLFSTNRLSEAEPLMRQALEIDEESYGKDHPKVATSLSNLAQLLQATNRHSEAEPLMRQALEIDEKSYGKDHPNVATSLSNQAALLQATNRLSEAEPLMRRALEIDEKNYGKNHPNVAIRLNNLAQLFQATNRLSEAEILIRRSLEIDEKSYGKDHPNVATDLNNLAQLLQATNRLAEAEPLMRRALEIDERSYGKDHPNVATRLNNLASLYYSTNRLAEAEPLMRRVLEILVGFLRATGHAHPNLDAAANNYCAILDSLGASKGQITAILALLAPELFEQPPSREAAIAFAQQQLAEARASGNETIARILEEILEEQQS